MPIYFVIALVGIYQLMKVYEGRHKWLRFFLLAFLFYLPVGWDVLLGRAYFHYLCHKDGGVHIYQTVELDSENWYADGSPKFYDIKGNFDEDYFEGRYIQVDIFRGHDFKTQLPILRDLIRVIDTDSGLVFGEVISYLYIGGWVINTWQPFSTRGQRCPRLSDYPEPSELQDNPLVKGIGPKWYRKFTSYIFLNKNNKEVE